MAPRANKSTPSTQKSLNIAEIKEDVVVLKDGTMQAILLVSSINFALKSEEEQNAIIGGYVSFLNLLDSPLQIVIQSRQLDLDAYLADLAQREKEQTNDLLKLQTAEYRQYVNQLIELSDIMTKRFYVIVTLSDVTATKGFFQKMTSVFLPGTSIKMSQKVFGEKRQQLMLRVEKIATGLSSMSLRATMLDTQSLIELYYNTYNPVISRQQKMPEVDKLGVEQ